MGFKLQQTPSGQGEDRQKEERTVLKCVTISPDPLNKEKLNARRRPKQKFDFLNSEL